MDLCGVNRWRGQPFNLAWEGHDQAGNVKRFRGWLVFKAHILLYHLTLSLRVIKKKIKQDDETKAQEGERVRWSIGTGTFVSGFECRVERFSGNGFKVCGLGVWTERTWLAMGPFLFRVSGLGFGV